MARGSVWKWDSPCLPAVCRGFVRYTGTQVAHKKQDYEEQPEADNTQQFSFQKQTAKAKAVQERMFCGLWFTQEMERWAWILQFFLPMGCKKILSYHVALIPVLHAPAWTSPLVLCPATSCLWDDVALVFSLSQTFSLSSTEPHLSRSMWLRSDVIF